MANIMNAMLISIYVLLFVIGASIVIYALFNYLKGRSIVLLEHIAIIGFTLVRSGLWVRNIVKTE